MLFDFNLKISNSSKIDDPTFLKAFLCVLFLLNV